ncbi:Fc.00g027510.m01.CDS01 [Cosmosporella sp. VM-42]
MARPKSIGFCCSIFLLFHFALFLQSCHAQAQCNKDNLCATGCCSAAGFCGVGDEYCGEGCQSTCDYKVQCDENSPCQDGTCCNKFGYCGLGPDYCKSNVCIGNCDAKSECDPGFGLQWAKSADCPLNACCSEFGFCGLTKEFCGDNTVSRPSCQAKDTPVSRVVGYYESWASRRPCDRFKPSNIPTGVYTHINFAYASVDPSTYEITPATKGDDQLYKLLTNLKLQDLDLKVFISIGGWAFSEADATKTIFSETAASEEKQKVFIQSLISFMNTNDFDGVDIDWRYPGVETRGGSSADFKNFPVFAKHLHDALQSNSYRNGLSITLPASFSSLQHFDISTLEGNVDWFNFMSFDLHSTWDGPDSSLNNALNAHTNLTEITDAIDLLWRNNIPASKVVMGLAFYSRTFTASDTECVSKGCSFDSGGGSGPCSREIGLLTNSEITSLITSLSVTTELDNVAAVKLFTDEDQWIAYDDEDTITIKVEFARSHCMGGVMVWAISQDTKDGRFSEALQKATASSTDGSNSTTAKRNELQKRDTFGDGSIAQEIPRDQCRWTNCGESCPSGWQLVPRSDPYKEANPEYMFDDTACEDAGSRQFCCPPGNLPTCQWLYHNGGKCNPECPRNLVQVGSTDIACNNGLSQLACCSNYTAQAEGGWDSAAESAKIWDKCKWHGKEPNCVAKDEDDVCASEGRRRERLISSYGGSGSTTCWEKTGWFSWAEYPQAYCCTPPEDGNRWTDCAWNYNGDSEDRHCDTNCPSGFSKVALDDNKNVCKSGSRAYCCKARVTTAAHSAEESEERMRELMEGWIWNPVCPVNPNAFPHFSTPTVEDTSPDLVVRQTEIKASEPAQMEYVAVYILLRLASDAATDLVYQLWDDIVPTKYSHVTVENVQEAFSDEVPQIKEYFPNNKQGAADTLTCQMDEWEAFFGEGGLSKKPNCSIEFLYEADPHLARDEDDDQDDPDLGDFESLFDGFDVIINIGGSELDSRVGSARKFKVKLNNRSFTIRSVTYINGDNGHNLQRATGDGNRYFLWIDPDDCSISEFREDGDDDVPVHGKSPTLIPVFCTRANQAAAEHLIEQQTIPQFVQYMATGSLPDVNTDSEHPELSQPMTNSLAPNGLGDEIVTDYLATGFQAWEAEYGDTTPLTAIFNQLGSQDTPEVMLNLQGSINLMKARLWRRRAAVSENRFDNSLMQITDAGFGSAAAAVHQIFAVFDYLNANEALSRLRTIHEGIARIMRDFERLYRQQRIADGQADPGDLHLDEMWTNFINAYVRQIVLNSQEWLGDSLEELVTSWASAGQELWNQALQGSANAAQPAQSVLYNQRARVLNEMYEEIEDVVAFQPGKDFFTVPPDDDSDDDSNDDSDGS